MRGSQSGARVSSDTTDKREKTGLSASCNAHRGGAVRPGQVWGPGGVKGTPPTTRLSSAEKGQEGKQSSAGDETQGVVHAGTLLYLEPYTNPKLFLNFVYDLGLAVWILSLLFSTKDFLRCLPLV